MAEEETQETVETQETTEETQTEEVKEEQSTTETEEKPKPEAKPKQTHAERQAEINKATWEKHEAARKLEAATAAAKEEREKLEEARKGSLTKPKVDDFDSTEAYEQAADKYYKDVNALDVPKQVDAGIQKKDQQAKEEKIFSTWNFKKQAAIQKDPSFAQQEQVVSSAFKAFNTHPAIGQTLLESDQVVEIVSYLGQNPEELQQITQSSPGIAIKALGKLEVKLTAPKKKNDPLPKPTTASPGGGGASSTADLSKMSMADYKEYMNKKQFGK